jgi:amidase
MDINGLALEQASIAQIQAAMFMGEITARQIVEACLERISSLDQAGPALNAVVTINDDALSTADELDKALEHDGEPVGPLHGIPVVVKDCLDTKDMPTSYGSEVFADYRPGEDAAVIKKLRDAGAVIVAKTTLPDWATSWFAYSSLSGETKNPYDLGRDPGGSSSGTGAAVAAGYTTVGLGTDCGGSVRLPASFCNLVGVRSTPGLLSRRGCNPLVAMQDTIGPMARSVEDAARVFDVMVGFDPEDELTYRNVIARAPDSYLGFLVPSALRGLRIGVVRNAFGSDDNEDSLPVNRVMETALTELSAGGATLVDVEIPNLNDWLVATSLYLVKSKYDIDRWLATKPDAPMKTVDEIAASKRYHPMLDLFEGIAEGPDDPFADPEYYPAYVARDEFKQTVISLMGSHELDALVYPTSQLVPPTREQTNSGQYTVLNFPTNTLICSQTDTCAISVPAGLTDKGLPVGMEILARPYDEPTAFKVAYGFEQVVGHRAIPKAASTDA